MSETNPTVGSECCNTSRREFVKTIGTAALAGL